MADNDSLPIPDFKEPLGIGWDKAMHFGAGALSGECGKIAADGIGRLTGLWKPKSAVSNIVAPIVAATLAGTAKEILDSKQPGNKFDTRDLAATIAGSLPGAGIRATWKY